MSSRPWMPFYVADYLGDTGHLTTVEHGAYLLLIMHYWQAGGLPNDTKKLQRITKLTHRDWEKVRDTIAGFFNDGWRHKRIDSELAKASKMLMKRSAAGKMGAFARYSDRMANAKQTHAIAIASDMANAWQTDSIVRVRNNYNHIEPSSSVQSSTPSQKKNGSAGQEEPAPAPETIPVSEALATRFRK